MNSNKIPVRETIALAIGEAVVSLLVVLGFILFDKFDYKVILGALLGSLVNVLNFLFLSISVNRAIDNCLANYNKEDYKEKEDASKEAKEETENNEDDVYDDDYDDSARRFANEYSGKLQNAVKLSYTVRTLSIVIALVLAFLTKQFNVLATAIPLCTMRPVLTVSELIKKRKEEKN